MNRLTSAQHARVLFNSSRARLRLLRVMNPIQDRIPVNPVELVEVTLSARIAIEHRLQIFRDLRLALRCVCEVPSSIDLGLLDFPHTRRANATELDQYERPLTIELRPLSFWTTRRETNQPIVRVELIDLSVNPSVAQRAVDCFLLRDARDTRRRLRQLQPHALRRARLCRKPGFPLGARCESAHGKFASGLRRRHWSSVLLRARQVVVEWHAETVERPRDEVVLPDRENRVHHLLDAVAL